MKVLFYLDRVMHYHESTFREMEKRLENEGGALVVVSGLNLKKDTGRVALSNSVVKEHLFARFYEWSWGTYTFRWQPTLCKVVREIAPDVLIVMGHVGCVTYWRLGSLSRELGFKYVTWQCGYEYNPGRIKGFLTKRFLRQFHYHLAYHTGAKKYLLTHGVTQAKIAVIHNTIDEQKIHLSPRDEARQKVATELGLPHDRPIVLYVGAILAEKRLTVLLDAVRLLKRHTVSLVIVGDGPALAELKSLSRDLDCVRYPGRVIKDVGRFFDAADIFVLPGTGGLAINEAMVHGLPIVTGLADGSAEDLVADGLNGYVLKQGHAEEIATCLEKLLSDPETRLRMGRVSRELITTKYSLMNFIDRIFEGLHVALGESRPDAQEQEEPRHREAANMLSHH